VHYSQHNIFADLEMDGEEDPDSDDTELIDTCVTISLASSVDKNASKDLAFGDRRQPAPPRESLRSPPKKEYGVMQQTKRTRKKTTRATFSKTSWHFMSVPRLGRALPGILVYGKRSVVDGSATSTVSTLHERYGFSIKCQTRTKPTST
jgi:hypothetical protein